MWVFGEARRITCRDYIVNCLFIKECIFFYLPRAFSMQNWIICMPYVVLRTVLSSRATRLVLVNRTFLKWKMWKSRSQWGSNSRIIWSRDFIMLLYWNFMYENHCLKVWTFSLTLTYSVECREIMQNHSPDSQPCIWTPLT